MSGRPATGVAGWRARGLALGVLLSLTACQTGDDVDPETARTSLEQQRTEVRDLVARLATGVADRIGGAVRPYGGRYTGCTSVFPEGHRDFQYVVRLRIDAGPEASTPLLGAVETVLSDAGLEATAGERVGGRTLGVREGQVGVTFSELPAQGRYVLLDASGPCVEVPEEQREEWEGRVDETPVVG